MSWKVAHACVRGSSHQRSGLPNQDAVQCTVTPAAQGTVAVAVVSDGHGSPRHFRSQIGSSLAVSTVAATLPGISSRFRGRQRPGALCPRTSA